MVQGIGFRPFVYRIAVKRNLVGNVRNLRDSSVEIIVQGDENSIYSFVDELINNKPPLALYEDIIKKEIKKEPNFTKFSIDRSSYEQGFSNIIIPPDICICNECLKELRSPKNNRYAYPFNSCAECGPRYTIIKELPYDRRTITMSDFDLCNRCTSEYCDPISRRFNAQTISCANCGPELQLTDNKGVPLPTNDPLSLTARLLDEGAIIAIKGIGGFHISTSAIKSQSIERLRNNKRRGKKPFAVMSKNIETTRTFAIVDIMEEDLLTSHARPIVLLAKSDQYYLSPLISPNLCNIGVMLPYTGTQYLLLDNLADSTLVMTSANYNSEPIIKDN
jgi:hydrogenase maturation protein HypF